MKGLNLMTLRALGVKPIIPTTPVRRFASLTPLRGVAHLCATPAPRHVIASHSTRFLERVVCLSVVSGAVNLHPPHPPQAWRKVGKVRATQHLSTAFHLHISGYRCCPTGFVRAMRGSP